MALSPPGLSPKAVRAGRGPRPAVAEAVAAGRPLDWLVETERGSSGEQQIALTVFLAGAECPFSCVYCDLWQHTTNAPTPAGSLPRQLENALEESRGQTAATCPAETSGGGFRRLKLYNASNLFEERAVPAADDERLLELSTGFDAVTVECHPRLVGERARRFAEALAERGARLEVAMGLEVADDGVLRKLGKGASLDDFAGAAERLAGWGASWRAFALVGAPFVEREAWRDSISGTVGWALEHGAERVALIPVRGGTAPMEELARRGDWRASELADLERALDDGLAVAAKRGEGIVTVDLWDAGDFASCDACRAERLSRLARINDSGMPESRVECDVCGAGG